MPAAVPRSDSAAAPLSAARVCLDLLLWVAAVVVLSSALAPPCYWLLEAFSPGAFPFSRVFRRVASAVAVVLLWLLLRRWGVRSWAGLGWRRSPGQWRAMTIWLGGGLAFGLVFAASEMALGERYWRLRLTAGGLVTAVLGALIIGFLEETIFRGALLLGLEQRVRRGLAAVAITGSALYSTVHFARGGRGRVAGTWDGGLQLWSEVPGALVQYRQAWCGLFVVGLLFCAIAWLHGRLAEVTGIHAGVVLALQLVSHLTGTLLPDRSSWFVDGLLPGWRLAVLMGVVAAALVVHGRRRRADGSRPVSVEEGSGGNERR